MSEKRQNLHLIRPITGSRAELAILRKDPDSCSEHELMNKILLLSRVRDGDFPHLDAILTVRHYCVQRLLYLRATADQRFRDAREHAKKAERLYNRLPDAYQWR